MEEKKISLMEPYIYSDDEYEMFKNNCKAFHEEVVPKIKEMITENHINIQDFVLWHQNDQRNIEVLKKETQSQYHKFGHEVFVLVFLWWRKKTGSFANRLIFDWHGERLLQMGLMKQRYRFYSAYHFFLKSDSIQPIFQGWEWETIFEWLLDNCEYANKYKAHEIEGFDSAYKFLMKLKSNNYRNDLMGEISSLLDGLDKYYGISIDENQCVRSERPIHLFYDPSEVAQKYVLAQNTLTSTGYHLISNNILSPEEWKNLEEIIASEVENFYTIPKSEIVIQEQYIPQPQSKYTPEIMQEFWQLENNRIRLGKVEFEFENKTYVITAKKELAERFLKSKGLDPTKVESFQTQANKFNAAKPKQG